MLTKVQRVNNISRPAVQIRHPARSREAVDRKGSLVM